MDEYIATYREVFLNTNNETIPLYNRIKEMVYGQSILASAERLLSQYPGLKTEKSPIPGHGLFKEYLTPDEYETTEEMLRRISPVIPRATMPVVDRLVSYVEEVKAIRELYLVVDSILSGKIRKRDALQKCKLLHYCYKLIRAIEIYGENVLIQS